MNKDEMIKMSKEAYYEALNAAQESGQRMGYAQAKQETARAILQELKDILIKPHSFGDERVMIELIAEEYGIELE